MADHRGDKQKFFPTNYVRFLTKDELQYIRDVVSLHIPYHLLTLVLLYFLLVERVLSYIA